MKDMQYPYEVTIYKDGRFIQWDNSTKTPIYYNRDPSDFHRTLGVHWGPYSWAHVTAEMRIAEEYGTIPGPTVRIEGLVAGNRLGDDGSELSIDEILEKFVLDGLSVNLPMKFYTLESKTPWSEEEIKVIEERQRKRREWQEERLSQITQEHKQKMMELGFPFYALPDG